MSFSLHVSFFDFSGRFVQFLYFLRVNFEPRHVKMVKFYLICASTAVVLACQACVFPLLNVCVQLCMLVSGSLQVCKHVIGAVVLKWVCRS